jgi:flagellar basal body rod protein FlgG
MNVSLYQAASALTANARWQDVISQNLSAASVPGYKKQDLSFSTVEAGVLAKNAASKVALPLAQVSTSFANGEMKATGNKTDVAIEGPGFFEVQLANGSSAFTRDGEFQINAQGELVTKQGYAVQGEGGPIQLDRNNHSPITISPDGQVSQGNEVRGKLKVVDFDNPRLLTTINGGYFLAVNPNLQSTTLQQPSVRQGYLESANTSTVLEMANLIRAMRSFESNQKIIQTQDDRMSKAINDLGSPT